MKSFRAALAVGAVLLSANTALAAPMFQLVSPGSKDYVWGTGEFGDFAQFAGSIADVSAMIQAVNVLDPPLAGPSDSGCAAGDFAGFMAGKIALMQRGGCTITDKTHNAAAAGAVGSIIFNYDLAGGYASEFSLGGPAAAIPNFTTSYAVGLELLTLLSSGQVTVRMITDEIDTDAPVAPAPGAVPEPATWAMMIAGLGLVGGEMRRRRRAILSGFAG